MIRRDRMVQLGFGFGEGRRVIKTIYAGDRLQAALARQRLWCARHGVEDRAPLRMAKAALRPKSPKADDDKPLTRRVTQADQTVLQSSASPDGGNP